MPRNRSRKVLLPDHNFNLNHTLALKQVSVKPDLTPTIPSLFTEHRIHQPKASTPAHPVSHTRSAAYNHIDVRHTSALLHKGRLHSDTRIGHSGGHSAFGPAAHAGGLPPSISTPAALSESMLSIFTSAGGAGHFPSSSFLT